MVADPDEALYLLCRIMAQADGGVSIEERDAILRRLVARGILLPVGRSDELNRRAERAVPDSRVEMDHIVRLMPSEQQRADALATATEIVCADRALQDSEVEQLQHLADALRVVAPVL